MPRDYDWALHYDRNRVKRETREIVLESTVPVGSELTYEQYCEAVGVPLTAARGASCLTALMAFVSADPIGRAMGR